MRPTITRALLATACVLALAAPHAAEAATGASSRRAAAPAVRVLTPHAGCWTRAGLIGSARPASEIASAKKHREDPPPAATATHSTLAARVTVGQQQDRRSPSSARATRDDSATAHLRTSSAPDRRARSAHLAMLAGIFYEAHAPPKPAHTGFIS